MLFFFNLKELSKELVASGGTGIYIFIHTITETVQCIKVSLILQYKYISVFDSKPLPAGLIKLRQTTN